MRLSASILALGLALTACSGDQTAGNGGGTVIAGMGGDPSSLFPSLAQDETAFAVGDLLFEKLAAIGPSLSSVGDKDFTPRLAQSWDWARDSMSITFHLNPAARFHDGTPVTANDVRYTFRIIKDTTLGSTFTSLIANIDSVTVVDSLTPVFWYHRRTATQFFDAVYQVAPVPEHIYGKVPVAELKTSDITKNPVGTGRFRFVRYEPGTRIELVADTANFLGRPKLDRVIFMIGQNPPTASQSVLAGQMDFYVAFPIDQVDRLDSSTVARPIVYEYNGYGFAGINMFARKSTTVPHPILSDVRVRRALSMSLDRRAMLTNVFKSTGRLAYGPFPTGVALSDSTIGPPPYDTAAAGRLLDEAGWKRGPNGVRMKNGKPLEIEILAPSTSLIRIRYADLMQDQLNRVGFKAEVARAAMAEFGPRAGSRDYDMIVLAVNTDPSVAGIQQFWSSAGIPAGSNFMNYANRKVDAALDSATWAPTLAARSAYLTRAFRQIIDDAPAVWLYSASVTAAINRRIEAPTLPRNGWWNNLAEWSIPADKRIDRDRVGLRPTATP
jgi:peptide/nickel transport system substrate-binding protein